MPNSMPRREFTLFQGILLVYDVTDQKSFQNIENWVSQIDKVILR